MIITLITAERMYTVSLPSKVNGRYWLSDCDKAGQPRQVAYVEGVQGQWILYGNSELALLDDDGHEAKTNVLSERIQVINGIYRDTDQRIQLLVEPSTPDRQQYSKYLVSKSCRLNIGRANDNQLIFNNRFVSAHHACLIWKEQQWSITDTQSSNGIFVNERRTVISPLSPGDVLYIMGLKIIVGDGFFAVNNPDNCLQVESDAVQKFVPQAARPQAPDYREYPGPEKFSRSPRIYKEILSREIQIDAPPAMSDMQETPLALLLGPALTMGMTAIVMGAVAISNLVSGTSTLSSALPTIIMSFSMLCATLLWPPLTKWHEKRIKARNEVHRQNRYREYLDDINNQVLALAEEQKEILLKNCPSSAECTARILNRDNNLWERSIEQADFLRVRLGTGSLPLKVKFKFPDQRFSLEDDVLQNDLKRFSDQPKLINAAPVTCSLIDTPIVGVVGDTQVTADFVKGLILQIAALHSYDEVKLIMLTNKFSYAEWEFSRLLLHAWSEQRDLRYFVVDGDDAKALSSALEPVLASREAPQGAQDGEPSPHYVIIAASTELAEKLGVLPRIHSAGRNLGIACIAMAQQLTQLPQECSLIIEVNEKESVLYNRSNWDESHIAFQAETVQKDAADQAAAVLANLTLDKHGENFTIPSLLTFLEMYGVGKVEHLNALTRWKDNSPVNTLQAPVGVSQDGSTFYLDLHEKFHGPHGLIAGMTGSGKSEFIITFILSMAVNYHPDEVSFILIDYKGGGLAGAFEDRITGACLPHLAGTITNLDGAEVHRALISIQSELRRRQKIFNDARQVSGEGTIDIYKYQKMYRSGLVSEAVPHLFIVSDEFAELKSQQPEFMAQLISAARIGRSLGVHLILATQKPSGVVDDQIWSNSRFRVCLKVQERADSIEMLKRPDAAELKETGRFYLQVGFNELFSLGQSAWCGAPYVPLEQVEKKRDNSVEVIDDLGRVQIETKPQTGAEDVGSRSQVVAIVSYLSELAAGEQIRARQLWLPPIPAIIYLEDLKAKYAWNADKLMLNPIIGEFDDPFNQSQGLVTMPFTEKGNALIYGTTGSGKTTLINTVLCGLIQCYDADHLNIYMIDMGEETLRAFEQAPQVGDVLISTDGEKVQNLFKFLREQITSRKKLFSEADGSYVAYCKQTGNTIPQILIVLRNYSAFNESFEQMDSQLLQITQECSKYGIYFLMTANSVNAVRYKIAQNFPIVMALQLNDRADYISLFGGTDKVYPTQLKGRGVFKKDRTYEFQTAHFAQDVSVQSIRHIAKTLASNANSFAPSVPILPSKVTPDFFQTDISSAAFPVGVEKASLQISCVNLAQSVITLLLTQDPAGMSPTVQGICELLTRLTDSLTVMDGASLLDEPDNFSYSYLRSSFSDCVEKLFQEMVHRNNVYKAAVKEALPLPVYDSKYFVITGVQSILDSLTDDEKDKLHTLLDRATPEYNIRFVLCDTARSMKELSQAKWYKRHITGSDGIWSGNGISDQYILKPSRMSKQLYADLPPHFGYVVKRGKPTLVKLVVSGQSEEDLDE